MLKLALISILFTISVLGQTSKIDSIFKSFNVNGSIVIYNLSDNDTLVYNRERAENSFLPASTFKIINSLIALQTKAVANEKEIIKWDGKKRFVPEWNRDQTLASAVKYSAVWAFQELVKRMGRDTIEHYVNLVNYGNKNIGGNLNSFWLDGDLRINSFEQIDLLKKLYFNQLPFSVEHQNIVKNILIVEKGNDYVLRAKTGLTARVPNKIGWYVGYVEKKNNVYFFATNIAIINKKDSKAREAITRKVLSNLGVI